jgi:hypothetical protein
MRMPGFGAAHGLGRPWRSGLIVPALGIGPTKADCIADCIESCLELTGSAERACKAACADACRLHPSATSGSGGSAGPYDPDAAGLRGTIEGYAFDYTSDDPWTRAARGRWGQGV